MIEQIFSDKNLKVKALLQRRDDLFIFEGEKLVSDLLGKNLNPLYLIVETDKIEQFSSLIPAGIRVWVVSERVMRKISVMKSSPSVIAVFEELPSGPCIYNEKVIFALDGIQDPGNLGTIFRCAAAFGIGGIALTGECIKPTNTKFLRAAQDSVFSVSTVKFKFLTDLITAAVEKNFNIYLTSSHRQERTSLIEEIKLPAVIVLGNEGSGIGEEFFKRFSSIAVEQTGEVESLNAGITGCILMNRISVHFGLMNR